MEWLAPRIRDPKLLELAGLILRPDLPSSDIPALRQSLYAKTFHWPELADFAGAQDILPPLIWSLQRRHLLMPVPKSLPPEKRAGFFITRLEEAFAVHQARRRGLQVQLHEAVAALSDAGITPLLLKGARYLLEGGDAWETARPMRDIDLLIPERQATAAINALTGIGYVADAPSGLQSHHLPELRQAGRYGVIELHTEALAPAGRRFLATEFLWRQAVAANVPQGAAKMLPAHWQALHGMLHHQACDDGHALRNLALKPLWEFCCLAQNLDAAAWRDMADHINASGGGALFADWCALASMIYSLPLPDGMALNGKALARAARTIAQARQPDIWRRSKYLRRQFARGFSREVMARRYDVPESRVGLRLRSRHVMFLLKRYRGQMGLRLLGRT